MSRRPLAPDVWEQALINGRRMHSSDTTAALAWAEQWYGAQGGRFAGEVARPDAEPVKNTLSDAASEALTLASDHGPGPAEREQPPAPPAPPAAKAKSRARQQGAA